MNSYELRSILSRYGLLLAIGLLNLLLGEHGLFYTIFTPLTIKPVYWFFHTLYDARFFEPNTIFFKGYYATIIPACVAGSAYYLLLIFNLTTPMNIRKRCITLVTLLFSFLIVNIARIALFGMLLFKGYHYFDLAHQAVWYFGSTVLVVILWFTTVYLFGIKEAPVLSDVRRLRQAISPSKN